MSNSQMDSGYLDAPHRESVDSFEDASPTNISLKQHPWKSARNSLGQRNDTQRKMGQAKREARKATTEQQQNEAVDEQDQSSPDSQRQRKSKKKDRRSKRSKEPRQKKSDRSKKTRNSPEKRKKRRDGSLAESCSGDTDDIALTTTLSGDSSLALTPSRDSISAVTNDSMASTPMTNDSIAEETTPITNESIEEESPKRIESSLDSTQDETLAHLVQMVESNDPMENGGTHSVPFADNDSDADSDYQCVDSSPIPYYNSSSAKTSSGDDLEFLSAADSDSILAQTRTLSSGSEYLSSDQDAQPPGQAENFAMEHRISMKALLDLLAERERYATEVDVNDKHTFKSGPLKKASHLLRGIWKVKFVEVRRGMFSYYEDAVSKDMEEGALVRKNIPLHANTCTCRAVKVQHKALSVSPGGAIFELSIEGGPKRLWMANSREERQAWIKAIHAATLGRSKTRGESDVDHSGESGAVSEESPYRLDLQLYAKIRTEISQAVSKQQYVGALSELVGKKLNVPVQWIQQQMDVVASERGDKAFHEDTITAGMGQLWKDLHRDTVQIDNQLFKGGSGHAPERIIGALMRGIMCSDKTSPLCENATVAQKNKYLISESQAVSYARDILLAGNRTRSGGDSYYCVNTLCRNPGLVVMVPSSLEAEPLLINVAHTRPEKKGRAKSDYSITEQSGWLMTRKKPHLPWKKRYFVLSEGTLSYFKKALPIPHGLQGQVTVADCTISVTRAPPVEGKKSPSHRKSDSTASDQFLLSIIEKDGLMDRQLLFEDEKKFILWTHSLEACCVEDSVLSQSAHSAGGAVKGGAFRMLRFLEEAMGLQEPLGDFILGEKTLIGNASELGLNSEAVRNCIAVASNSGANGRPTVMVSVKASTDYRICTLDPQGNEKEDTWATIRAVFLQNFRLSGGPTGRIIREEEIVQINVLDCHAPQKEAVQELAAPLSRFRKNRVTRRTMSS